jgi:hypothetical protein
MAPVAKCPVCTGPIQRVNIFGSDLGQIDCSICGSYSISGTFVTDQVSKGYTVLDRAHLSGWIRNQWRRGNDNIRLLTYDVEEILKNVSRLTTPEKAERLLLLFDQLNPIPGEMFLFDDFSQADAAAKDRSELMFYFISLVERGFIKNQGNNRYSLTMERYLEAQHCQPARNTDHRSASNFDQGRTAI